MNPGMVSIQIAAYNAAATLRGCLTSIRRETADDIEIMVTDDASTDTTADILRDAAAADPRIKIATNSTRRGEVESRRAMLENTAAKFVIPFNSNDIFIPGRIARQRQFLLGIPVLTAVYGKSLGWNSASRYAHYCAGRTLSNFHFFRRKPFEDGALMVRREVAVGLGNYLDIADGSEERIPGFASYFLYQRLSMAGPMHFDNTFAHLFRLPPPTFVAPPCPPPIQTRIQELMLMGFKNNYRELSESLLKNDSRQWQNFPPPLLLQILGLLTVAAKVGKQDELPLVNLAATLDPSDYGVLVSRIENRLELRDFPAATTAAAELETQFGDDPFVKMLGMRLAETAREQAGQPPSQERTTALRLAETILLGTNDEVTRIVKPLIPYCDMAF